MALPGFLLLRLPEMHACMHACNTTILGSISLWLPGTRRGSMELMFDLKETIGRSLCIDRSL